MSDQNLHTAAHRPNASPSWTLHHARYVSIDMFEACGFLRFGARYEEVRRNSGSQKLLTS